MKFSKYFLLIGALNCFSQSPNTFKGEHYALYNKCKAAVTFCEITQQDYLSCGSVKNCYGLYVLPGDTFYINIEDKNQSESISADISFGGYFPAILSFTFHPIDLNCIPQHALQIAIPLTATIGSSFQISAQNVSYVNPQPSLPGTPLPYHIFVGGAQPLYTFALEDFTNCPFVEEVGIRELPFNQQKPVFFPNPVSGVLSLLIFNSTVYILEIYDELGYLVLKQTSSEFIDVSMLKDGIYFCRIVNNDKIVMTDKLILTN
jgi:hypothetical protein